MKIKNNIKVIEIMANMCVFELLLDFKADKL